MGSIHERLSRVAIERRQGDVELHGDPEPARLRQADADGGGHLRVGGVELVAASRRT